MSTLASTFRAAACIALLGFAQAAVAAPPSAASGTNTLSGAISVTMASCGKVNGNIYISKDDVYVKPTTAVGGGSGLPNGSYYVQVTDPSGATVLSTVTPLVTVLNGKINGLSCVQLSSIAPYADTPNNGGEYKVWFSTLSTFGGSATKTDNFKVRTAAPPAGDANIAVWKFYDSNVDGGYAGPEQLITGWQVGVDDLTALTSATFGQLPNATYTVYENQPLGNNILNAYAWVATNAYVDGAFAFTGPTPGSNFNSIGVNLESGGNVTVLFGNVCIGPNVGGKTLGYWSNKNGQADLTSQMASHLAALSQLNLVKPDGSAFDPANYSALRNWLLNGNAVNMAYMLSVQLSALQLSVLTNKLSLATVVYAPGVLSANAAGFITIGNLIQTANSQLGSYPQTYAGFSQRMVQEALKNAIDDINNNRASVVQADGSRCPALNF